ncbi:hypothetical protein GCM10020254_62020 [Streptomyces goshikiensis]
MTPGSSRPRATRVSAWTAAVPQARVAGCAPALRGARARSGRAAATDRTRPGTVRVRGAAVGPCGRTSVSGIVSPGRGSPSGAQNTIRPSRGTGAGRNTAACRSSAVCGVTRAPSESVFHSFDESRRSH